VPDDKENEFFGFFAFSGKATAFLGPFFYGLICSMGRSPSWALSVTVLFYAVGGLILLSVDERDGIRRAARDESPGV
jgi:UMF1 family MFS transporter